MSASPVPEPPAPTQAERESEPQANPPNPEPPKTEELPNTELPSQQDDHSDPVSKISSSSRSSSPNPKDEAQNPNSDDDDADDDAEEGEIPESDEPSPKQELPSSSHPPLPPGPPPGASIDASGPTPEDDGWDFQWDASHQAYFFYNRFTGATTWENPRTTAPEATAPDPSSTPAPPPLLTSSALPPPPQSEALPAGGYNPAIHGDYDPEAWYAKPASEQQSTLAAATANNPGAAEALKAELFSATAATFDGVVGGADDHSDEAKSRRQLNSYFDVDAAANRHDGRSLKAERSGMKPSKKEVKAYKEKRRARKEEKRRAWLKE